MRASTIGLALVLVGAASLALRAYDQSSSSFEVVSIKPRTTAAGPGVPASPERFIAVNESLHDLVQFAFDVQGFQVIGGPDWVKADRFDVDAKASFAPTADQMRVMVQALLADRFRLKVVRARREMAVYNLRLVRSSGELGPQLTRTTVDCAAVEAARAGAGQPAPSAPSRSGERPVCATWLAARPTPSGVTVRYQTSGATIQELAAFFSSYAGRPVIDATALSGDFDVDVSFDPSNRPPVSPDAAALPTLFTAVGEQLGLRLESAREDIDVLVIESAERPSPN